MDLRFLLGLVTWDTAFSESPAGSDSPSAGDDRIRELKEALQERLDSEHHWDLASGGASVQGWHREGSAKAYYESAEPTQRPDAATSLDSNDAGRLWIDSDDQTLYHYSGSAWVAIALDEGSISAGTARQLLQTNAGGTAAEWASNIDVPGTLDVTGAATLDSTLAVTGAVTLTVALASGQGGTGLSSYTAGDLLYFASGTALSKLGIGTARQLLQTNSGASAPEWASNIDVPGTLDVTGATQLDSTLSVSGVSTLADDLVFSANKVIRRDTADGSDSGSLALTGGGAQGIARGSQVRLDGNEHATRPGHASLIAGNVSGGVARLLTGAGIVRLEVEDGGNVKIGSSLPASADGTLHVHTGSAGSVSADANADELVVENSANGGVSLLTPDGSSGRLFFGSPSAAEGASVAWGYTAGLLDIRTKKAGAEIRIFSGNNTEALRIDSSQQVLIGATSAVASAKLEVTGKAYISTTLELGHATDTTLARASTGDVNIEGNIIYRAGGTDVPVGDGGTGSSTAAGAATNLGLGTGDSPQFSAINLGHATDTTLARVSAGVVSIEGATIRTGTVGETVGGTGQTSYTTGDVLYSDASNSLAKLGVGTENQYLRVSAGGVPEWADVSEAEVTEGGADEVLVTNSGATAAEWAKLLNANISASANIDENKLNKGSGNTVLVTESGGTVVSWASLVDANISASAEIAVSKLADGTARQLLQTDAAGTGVEWASNIDVPGTLDVAGVSTFDSVATLTKGATTSVVHQDISAPTQNEIFDAFSASLTEGVEVAARGVIETTTNEGLFVWAVEKTSSTVIRFKGSSFTLGSSPEINGTGSLDATDGSGSTWVSIRVWI